MLVGYGHYDADGDEEDGADGEGEEESVPGEVDWVAGGVSGDVVVESVDLLFDHENANGEHTDEGDEIPA